MNTVLYCDFVVIGGFSDWWFVILELDFFDKTVKGAQILHIDADEWINTFLWFEVDKELFLYLLMKKIDEVNACGQFWVLLFW